MIDVIMEFAGGYYLIRVKGHNVEFGAKTASTPLMSTIDNMKLDYGGVVKEFPDLANSNDWREEAISRFKDRIKDLQREEDIMNYLIKDLERFGYKPLYKQKAGFRTEVFK